MIFNIFKKKKEQINIEETPIFERTISLEEWIKEFSVGSKYYTDSTTELEIKRLKIISAQKYNKTYQNRCQL